MRGSSGRILVGLLAGGSMLALGLAGWRVPLLASPGFELAAAGVLCTTLLGAPLGLAAARRELARSQVSALRAFGQTALALIAFQVILFGISAVRAAIGARCSVSVGLAFLPVLALPCALLAASLGTFAGIAARGRRLAAILLYVTMASVSLAWSLRTAYFGPAAYFLDHLLGYWPGPLYDEAVAIDRRLLLFQIGTLAWTTVLVTASTLLPAVRLRAAREIHSRHQWLSQLMVLSLALGLAASTRAVMISWGDLATREYLGEVLGGSRQGPTCHLVFPAEKSPEEAERLARDCELDAALIATALQLEKPPRVTVYFHRSEAEKRQLVGAGQTDYTKPWLAEVHVLDAPAPHPVLRHELVHALASTFARDPLRVPARLGVLVSPGLIEGLAVAIDLPHGDWTVHEWTRAMRDLGFMPRLADLVGPVGFFGAPPARAYTVAGSFLSFLLQHYGPGPTKRLYGDTPFLVAFGKPLEALEAEWSSFLDRVEVPAPLRAAAEARFRGESLFFRACAREVAGLEARAQSLGKSQRPMEAAVLWRRVAQLSDDPKALRAAGEALARAGELDSAERTFEEALQRAAGRRSLESALKMALGDLRWRRQDALGAAERYRSALKLDPNSSETRLLEAKLMASEDPALGEEAGPWLLQLGDQAVALARLTRSKSVLAQYLVGRAYVTRGFPRLAVKALLPVVGSSDLPGDDFSYEARRLLAEAHCAAGDWELSVAEFTSLARQTPSPAQQQRAADGARRCELEKELFQTPVAMPGDDR